MDAQNSKDEHVIQVGSNVIRVCSNVPSTEGTSEGSKACAGTTCGFFDSTQKRSASIIKLSVGLILCIFITGVDVAWGDKTNSKAIFTDASSFLTNFMTFAISLFSLCIAGWKTTPHELRRVLEMEVVGVFVLTMIIWTSAVSHVMQAIVRLMIWDKREVNGFLMFKISAFGLLVNIISSILLGHDHYAHHNHAQDERHHIHGEGPHEPLLNSSNEGGEKKKQLNINNLRGCIQSVCVMVSGAIIWYKPEWKIIDLICSLIFSIILLVTPILMIRNFAALVNENISREIDEEELERGVYGIEEVVVVYGLDIWATGAGKILLDCRVGIGSEANAVVVSKKIIDYVKTEYNIDHVTIQIGRE